MNSPKHSTHHILAKEKWGSNNKKNLVELRHTTHQAIHTVFGTEIMPDKLKKLIWVEYTALKSSVVAQLLSVIDNIWENAEDRYKEECFLDSKKK